MSSRLHKLASMSGNTQTWVNERPGADAGWRARVAALEGVQATQAARARVLIRAVEQEPRATELEANGTVMTLELLAKVLEPPQK